MTEKEIQELLEKRYNMLLQIQEIEAGYKSMIDKILTPELRAEIAEIEAEQETATKNYKEQLENMETSIRDGVVALKKSVKAKGFGMGVFNKGSAKWDTDGLQKRMLEAQYEWLKNYFDPGKPYCTIRKA